MKGYEKPTETERRGKFSKYMSFISLAAMFVFIVLLIAGGFMSDGRSCIETEVLENAVCVTCKDKNCYSCIKSGSTQCN